MKKIILPIILFFLGITLFSCSNNKTTDSNKKFVPIYEGISLVESSTSHKVRRANLLDDDDFDYESVIPDVIVDSDVTYYATPGSEVRVEIHIKNPSQFEILSLTINDLKYQSYQFEDGSNSEVLFIDVKAPETSGEHKYTIDNIKYIDGDDIEDVDMSNGNKTINFGVTYDNLPTLNITNKVLTKNSYSMTVQSVDKDAVLQNGNGLRAYLFDASKKLVRTLKLTSEELLLDNLEEGKSYHLVLATGLDLLDGKGGKTHILYEEDFTTNSSAYFGALDIKNNSVTYSVIKDSESIVINSVQLIDLSINKGIDVTNNLEVTNLLSNHKYKLMLNYSNGVNNYVTSVTFSTLTNDLPVINGFNLTASKDSITFDYTITDTSKVVLKEEVVISKDNVVIQTVDAKNIKTISGLLSGVTYQACLKVTYNLGDGTKSEVIESVKDITTTKKETPIVGIDYEILDDKFSGNLNVVDVDSVFMLSHYELYNKDNVLIQKLDDITNVTNFKKNTSYILKVIYSYDLNDGLGNQKGEYVLNFTTGKQKPTITLNVIDKSDVSFKVDIIESDLNNIGEVKSIRLYNANNVYIKEIAVSNSFIFENLESNCEYIIKVEYSYDLNEGAGVVIDTYELKVLTLNQRPQIESLDLVSNKTSISYNFNISDNNNIVTNSKVTLYLNGLLVSDNPLNNEFTNLLSNSLYEVRLEVSYDLNDGKGIQTLTLNKEIKTLSKSLPKVGVDYNVTEGRFSGNLNIVDNDNVYNLVNIELLDKTGLFIKEITDLSLIDGLNLNTEYKLRVNYNYDLNDGNGLIEAEYMLTFTTGKQKPTLTLNVYDTTDVSFSVDLKEIDSNNIGEIKSIRLYNSNDVFLKEVVVSNSFSFTELTPNSDYVLKIEYSYDFGDGTGVKVDVYDAKIHTLNARPSVDTFIVENTKDSISYQYKITDVNNAITNISISLYQENMLISENPVDKVFTNLLSNTNYQVRLKISYDLNDGKGGQTIVVNKRVKTFAKLTPSIGINYSVVDNSFKGTLNVIDEDNIYKFNSYELLDQNGQSIKILNDISLIENLELDTAYSIRVNYSYDLNDGLGERKLSYVQNFRTTKKTPTVHINPYYVSMNFIQFDVTIDNPSNVNFYLNNVRIYNDLDVFIKEVYSSNTAYYVDDLQKNAPYKIKVTFSYDLGDGKGNRNGAVIKEISTTKEMPFGNLVLNPTKDSISASLVMNDPDNTGSVTKVNLLLNGEVIKSGLDYEFTNLLADNSYVVQVEYTYNLNDGNLDRVLVIEQTIKTLPYNVNILHTNLRTEANTITLDYKVLDETNTLKVNKIEVYEKGNTLALTIDNITSFTDVVLNNLKPSTYYKIITTYSYDALDGLGTQTREIETEYHTSTAEKLIVDRIEILNKQTLYPGEYLDARVFINNVNNLNICAIYVDGQRIETKLSATDSAIIKYVPVSNGGTYKMIVTGYEYIIEAENRQFNLVETLNIASEQSINILGDLKGVEVKTTEAMPYAVVNASNVILKYDGSTGYEIFSIKSNVGDITKDQITVLNENEVQFKLPSMYYAKFVINSIEYGIGNDKRLSNEVIIGQFGVVSESSNEIIHITKPEQLSTLNLGNIYVLDNDLDMTGIKLNPNELRGVFIGNNHVIKNFSYSDQNAIQYCYGLFTQIEAYVENLTIENSYVSVSKDKEASVGILAGNIYHSIIRNVNIVNSTISVKFSYNAYGNLAGLLSGELRYSNVYNVNISGKVEDLANTANTGLLSGRLWDTFVTNARLNGSADSGVCYTTSESNFIKNIHVSGEFDYPISFHSLDGSDILVDAMYKQLVYYAGTFERIIYFNNQSVDYYSYDLTMRYSISINGYGLIGSSVVTENCYATELIQPQEGTEIVGLATLKNKEFYLNLGYDESIWDFSDVTNLKFGFKF